AIIKSSNVFISTDENLQLSARNKFQGIVDSINQGGINSEIVIDIGNGDKIVAIITTSSVNSLNIKEKSKVGAIIKASDVMIGR
ncbi:TOBE domain-containing protein, partial [Aliarcobacter butzleri]